MLEESLAERVKSLSPAKRQLLLQALEHESLDTSWMPGRDFEALATETERILGGIWQDVLGVHTLSRTDSFFDLGGDSILSIRIVARAQAEGLKLSSRQLFDHPILLDLASRVERMEPPARAASVGARRRRPGWIPKPQDFPEADLSEEDLESILLRFDRGGAGESLSESSDWTASCEAAASGLRYPGELPRVLALRSARF